MPHSNVIARLRWAATDLGKFGHRFVALDFGKSPPIVIPVKFGKSGTLTRIFENLALGSASDERKRIKALRRATRASKRAKARQNLTRKVQS